MRICLASLHPRILSGQIDSLVGLGRALTRRGHEVSLVAPFDTGGLLDGTLASLDTGPHRLTTAATRMLKAVPRIIAESKRADVLHLALPTPAFSPVADIVRMATPTPILVGYEGHLAEGACVLERERLFQSWKTYLPLWGVNNGVVARISPYRCPLYVVSSRYQERELRSLGVDSARIEVAANLIESSKMVRCDPSVAREQFGLPRDKSVVGYIGHFNDVKGVDILARAFVKVAGEHAGAHLALAWSGQGNAVRIRRLLEPVSDRVTWLGKVHVGRFLSAIDALALPYRMTAGQGAFPSLVLEALHAGRPLVTTRLPLLEELLGGDDVALLCEPENPSSLACQVARLLDDPELRRSMARTQIRKVATTFAPSVLAARFESLYASLLTAAPTASEAAA